VAQLIRGEYSPNGKLPLTFYDAKKNTIPDISNYSMVGRTYRYINEEPLYPFGFGLSYTSFEYEDFEIVKNDEDSLCLQVKVTNTGDVTGTEKIQVYAHYSDSRTTTPNYQLCGIKAVDLAAGESKIVTLTIDKYWLKAVLEDGQRVVPNGEITLYIGGHQPDKLSCELCGNECLEMKIK
jgi:beta-glucosidase